MSFDYNIHKIYMFSDEVIMHEIMSKSIILAFFLQENKFIDIH